MTPKKILVVEDTQNLQNALKIVLSKAGFEVDTALNGEEGLALVDSKKYDLIITDMVMPKKNGLMFMKDLSDRKNLVPVIVISNVSRGGEQREAKELGAVAYFVKVETQLETLLEYVKMLLAN